MKTKVKIQKSLILSILLIILLGVSTLAATPSVTIKGELNAEPEQTKTLNISINYDKTAGVVSGKIEKRGNIKDITVTGKNGWNLTYNSETGAFNIYKAEGAKQEEIIEIKYTTTNAEGTGKIKLSNMQVTTTDYETENVADLEEEIVIKKAEEVKLSKIEITKAPNKTTYKEGEIFDKTGMIVKAIYSDGTSKEVADYTYTPNNTLKTSDKSVTVSYTENNIREVAEQRITVEKANASEKTSNQNTPGTSKDNTTIKNNLPKTGVGSIALFGLGGCTIFAIVSYVRYKKYNA